MRKKPRIFKKRYVHRQKRTVHIAKRAHKHPAFLIPGMTIGVLLVVVTVGLLVLTKGSNPLPKLTDTNSRIVIVNNDNMEQILPTRAETVGELLKKLDIKLHEGDVVEPAPDMEISNDNFRVNVYRALPVTIVDGSNKEVRALSAAATPRSIARQSGINAHPEDILQLEPVDDFVTQGMIGQKLAIKRATPVNLNLYGTQITARTQAKTVGDFLKEKNIKLGEGETVQPSSNTAISTTEPIFVNRKGIQVETVSEDIAFSTEFVDDSSLSFGIRVARQQGVPGKRVVTYQVNVETGARTKFQEIILQQPVASIVARGTYSNVPGDKQSVMAAAGIRPGEYSYVDFIVGKESRWNAGARNASSGAYGLCQAMPATKMASAGGDWQTNPVTQLRWCSGYAQSRYGGWAQAYSAWQSKGWW